MRYRGAPVRRQPATQPDQIRQSSATNRVVEAPWKARILISAIGLLRVTCARLPTRDASHPNLPIK